MNPLTADHHGKYREDLFTVRYWSNISKPYTRQNSEREVERRDVLRPDIRSPDGHRIVERVRHVRIVGQFVEPANATVDLDVGYCVEEAGQPMGDEGEGGHEKE